MMRSTLEEPPVKCFRVSWRIFSELNKQTTLHPYHPGSLDFNGIPVIYDPNLPDDGIVKEYSVQK
jgi:hypothetical protein